MNRHKWLHGELDKWRREGIVDESVVDVLKSRYPVATFETAGLIMFFSALLIGIGGIFLVAHNWRAIPDLLKLAILIAGMTGLYGAGENRRAAGKTVVGLALIYLGTLAFGIAMFLIGQMFHIVSYDAGALLIWSVATASVAWIYRNRFMMLTAVVLWTLAVLFQTVSYHQNPLWFLSAAVPYLYIAYQWQSRIVLFLTLAGTAAGCWTIFTYYDASPVWVYPVLLLLFGLSALFRNASFQPFFHYPLLFSLYIGLILQVTLFRSKNIDIAPSFWAYFAFAVLLVAVIVCLWREKSFQWLPVTAIYLPTATLKYAGVINAVLSLALTVYLISMGERNKEKLWINHGTVLFLITVFCLYTANVWSLLDSSLFFLVGGVVLFALAVLMERRRRKLVSSIREVE